jgi:hypothetical protein
MSYTHILVILLSPHTCLPAAAGIPGVLVFIADFPAIAGNPVVLLFPLSLLAPLLMLLQASLLWQAALLF